MATNPPASLPSLATKLRTHHRKHGTRGTARLVGARLWQVVRKRESYLVLAKDLNEIVVPVRRGRVRVEPLDRSHAAALRELNAQRPFDREAQPRTEADLAAGFGCFGGFVDDELVGCYWWADATMPPHRDMRLLRLRLGERDMYGSDFYVRADRRGGGTANDFLYQVEAALHDRGFAWLWGYVVAENRTARWVYDARGYETRWRIDRERVLLRWRDPIVTTEGAGPGA